MRDKHYAYHDWIIDELEAFEKELESINDQNYADAVEQLEKKYLSNVKE
ncbi:hypothetical protein NST62_09835 [Ureibacillus sp. FSL K6-8385]|nr:hypothetical protein [Ureibacillus terrenus]MED3661407.1 hypothetical protein [Ureibacillus terrenus]